MYSGLRKVECGLQATDCIKQKEVNHQQNVLYSQNKRGQDELASRTAKVES